MKIYKMMIKIMGIQKRDVYFETLEAAQRNIKSIRDAAELIGLSSVDFDMRIEEIVVRK